MQISISPSHLSRTLQKASASKKNNCSAEDDSIRKDRSFCNIEEESEMEDEKGKGSERWRAAIVNLSEMGSNLESLQKLLMKKAVFVDDEAFAKASLSSEQARTIKALETRVETLERELDAAITASAHARSEKRQTEAAQRAAELRAQELTRELENTTKVFKLHMEELRAKQEEISKKDSEIKLLEAIIQTLGGKESTSVRY